MVKTNLKKIYCIFFALCMIIALSAFSTGCKKGNTDSTSEDASSVSEKPAQSDVTKDEVSLSRTDVSLVFGDSAVIIAYYGGAEDKSLVWETSDESVVNVADGVITAVGVGNAVVTATYGSASATCSVTTTFGDCRPVLELENTSDNISLSKGDSYALKGLVSFNGKTYDCDVDVSSSDSDVAAYENGKIVAKGLGETTVTVTGKWNGFDTPLMRKELSVKVIGNVTMYATVTKGGETTVMDNIELSIVDSFAGHNFDNYAEVSLYVSEDGEQKTTGEIKVTEGSRYIGFENGVITAKGIGAATLVASYLGGDGLTYEKIITVNVTCPVVEYPGVFEWDNTKIRTEGISTIFGDGAIIVSAKQGGKQVATTKRTIEGLKFAGAKTEPIEVQTTKGGYYFSEVIGYDVLLTSENAASELALASKKLSGYYLLKSDIGTAENPISFSSQQNATDAASFAGTFDGNGYTVYADVYSNGIFGGFGSGAVIKDCKFVITFKTDDASGLASDKGRWTKKTSLNINNVMIETTNFGAKNHVISTYKVEYMKLKDVFVKVRGTEGLSDYNGEDDIGVLFGTDYSYNANQGGIGLNGFDNVRVVIDKFLPMGNGAGWSTIGYFLNFACNDIDKFGTDDEIERVSAVRDNVNYAVITGVGKHSDWLRDVYLGNGVWKKCITFYYGASAMKNGGVYRYDTVEDLLSHGVEVIGTWVVE